MQRSHCRWPVAWCGLQLALGAACVWALTAVCWWVQRTLAQRGMVCMVCLGIEGGGSVWWVMARACHVRRLLVWWAWRVQCCGAACLVQLGATCVVWCGSVLRMVALGSRAAAALWVCWVWCAVVCGRWCGVVVAAEGCVLLVSARVCAGWVVAAWCCGVRVIGRGSGVTWLV